MEMAASARAPLWPRGCVWRGCVRRARSWWARTNERTSELVSWEQTDDRPIERIKERTSARAEAEGRRAREVGRGCASARCRCAGCERCSSAAPMFCSPVARWRIAVCGARTNERARGGRRTSSARGGAPRQRPMALRGLRAKFVRGAVVVLARCALAYCGLPSARTRWRARAAAHLRLCSRPRPSTLGWADRTARRAKRGREHARVAWLRRRWITDSKGDITEACCGEPPAPRPRHLVLHLGELDKTYLFVRFFTCSQNTNITPFSFISKVFGHG